MARPIHVAQVHLGEDTESACPCTKQACGYVDIFNTSPECSVHTRQGSFMLRHMGEDCPGVDGKIIYPPTTPTSDDTSDETPTPTN